MPSCSVPRIWRVVYEIEYFACGNKPNTEHRMELFPPPEGDARVMIKPFFFIFLDKNKSPLRET